MSGPKDGGPAFPRPIGEHHPDYAGDCYHYSDAQPGMTLRDWFTGQAPEPSDCVVRAEMEFDAIRNPQGDGPPKPRRRTKLEIIAAYKYRYADAMLAAREVQS